MYNRTFFNNHNSVLNGVGTVISVFQFFAAIYFNIITDVGVFVDNGVFYVAPVPNTHQRGLTQMRLVYLL